MQAGIGTVLFTKYSQRFGRSFQRSGTDKKKEN